MFGLVTGFIERNEHPEAAAVREVAEELSLTATHPQFVGMYPFDQMNQLIIAYAVQADGEIVLNEELVDIIRTNVRADEQVIGDLLANVSCNEVGGRLLLEFMDEYGVDDLTTLADAILDQSERTTRAAIATIPDGRYANRI